MSLFLLFVIFGETKKRVRSSNQCKEKETELVVQLYLHTVISREDAIRFAEGLVLTEKDADDPAMMQKAGTEETEEYIRTMKFEVSANEMSNMHQIGEWLVLPEPFTAEGSGNTEVSARVAAVQVLDHISGLETAYMEDNVSEQADEEGKLLPNVIQYIKCGDGINTLDEVLYTEEIDQCMIYATVEYKNTGDTVLENEPFYVCLMRIQETDEAYTILKRKPEKSISGYDRIVSSAMASDGRMVYYDVQGGDSNGRNYIERLEPGETATVHMGFLANKDELDYLYLDLSGGGSAYEFSEESLKVGYVDIRGVK